MGIITPALAATAGVSYESRLTQGVIPGYRKVTIVGANGDIDTTGARAFPATLCASTDNVMLYPWPTAANLLEVVSSSPADTVGGTGLRYLLFDGISGTWDQIPFVVVPMNGTTPVPIPNGLQYLRVNTVLPLGAPGVAAAGSVGTNVGDVIIRVAGGGPTLGHIPIGKGSGQCVVYSTPRAESSRIIRFRVNMVRATGTAIVELRIRMTYFGGAWFTAASYGLNSGGASHIDIGPDEGPLFPGGTDYELRCVEVSANNTALYGHVELELVS